MGRNGLGASRRSRRYGWLRAIGLVGMGRRGGSRTYRVLAHDSFFLFALLRFGLRRQAFLLPTDAPEVVLLRFLFGTTAFFFLFALAAHPDLLDPMTARLNSNDLILAFPQPVDKLLSLHEVVFKTGNPCFVRVVVCGMPKAGKTPVSAYNHISRATTYIA